MALDALEDWALREALLDHAMAGRPAADTRRLLAAAGRTPVGPMAATPLDRLAVEAGGVAALARENAEQAGGNLHGVRVNLDVGGHRLTGSVPRVGPRRVPLGHQRPDEAGPAGPRAGWPTSPWRRTTAVRGRPCWSAARRTRRASRASGSSRRWRRRRAAASCATCSAGGTRPGPARCPATRAWRRASSTTVATEPSTRAAPATPCPSSPRRRSAVAARPADDPDVGLAFGGADPMNLRDTDDRNLQAVLAEELWSPLYACLRAGSGDDA